MLSLHDRDNTIGVCTLLLWESLLLKALGSFDKQFACLRSCVNETASEILLLSAAALFDVWFPFGFEGLSGCPMFCSG